MAEILVKIKRHSKKAVLFISLFLAVFVILFYVVNLDLDPGQIMPPDAKQAQSLGKELAKRLGSTTFAVENYDNWSKRHGLGNNSGLDADPDKDGLPNYLEYAHGTNPLKADTDSDKFSDKQEIINGYDPYDVGNTRLIVSVRIDKIGIEAPMVWSGSENENDMLKDLENGISHYAKTASPGQNGNMIISGHSSNYIWAKGDYNHVFKDLDKLEPGDIINVRTAQQYGRILTYQYKVSDEFVTIPNDADIFAATETPTLTLSTCWPPGTAFRRLIVKAELVK